MKKIVIGVLSYEFGLKAVSKSKINNKNVFEI